MPEVEASPTPEEVMLFSPQCSFDARRETAVQQVEEVEEARRLGGN
jgi:hypothetical protein